jgi:hypothetical protein
MALSAVSLRSCSLCFRHLCSLLFDARRSSLCSSVRFGSFPSVAGLFYSAPRVSSLQVLSVHYVTFLFGLCISVPYKSLHFASIHFSSAYSLRVGSHLFISLRPLHYSSARFSALRCSLIRSLRPFQVCSLHLSSVLFRSFQCGSVPFASDLFGRSITYPFFSTRYRQFSSFLYGHVYAVLFSSCLFGFQHFRSRHFGLHNIS